MLAKFISLEKINWPVVLPVALAVNLIVAFWLISKIDFNFDERHSHEVQRIKEGNYVYMNLKTMDVHARFSHSIIVEREFLPGLSWPIYNETFSGSIPTNIAKANPEVLTLSQSIGTKSYPFRVRVRDGKRLLADK
jgi:hypothetical protein